MKYLSLDDIKIPKPDFSLSKGNKGQIISSWLIEWVKYSLECGIADFGDFIPSKNDLANYLNVSTATIQNSIRQVKDLGYFTSKQSMGTCINDFYSNELKNQEDDLCHSTITECKIKKIVIDERIRLNQPILSVREFSKKTNISNNTIRFALINLERKGYLKKVVLKGNKCNWIYQKEFELTPDELLNGIQDEDFTLTHQLISKIQQYIEKTYKYGEKIHPNATFSKMFNVSIKTINDAMKVLNSKKIILSRRGRYGTIYIGTNQNTKMNFASSERKKITLQNYDYSWQKALGHLKKHIVENYKAGEKIAPIRKLASILNVSPNTVRRALSELFQNGYLISRRGKFGGIYVVEIPQLDEEKYKWLALNPDAIKFNN